MQEYLVGTGAINSFEATACPKTERGVFLKNHIVRFFFNSPIKFRLILLATGLVAGAAHPWLETRETLEASQGRMLLLLLFSILIYAFMLTLYRILQKLFKRRIELPEGKVDFDERKLVQAAGLFWFIPFGLSLQINIFNHLSSDANFGKIMIVQGVALSLAAWISQIIKK